LAILNIAIIEQGDVGELSYLYKYETAVEQIILCPNCQIYDYKIINSP